MKIKDLWVGADFKLPVDPENRLYCFLQHKHTDGVNIQRCIATIITYDEPIAPGQPIVSFDWDEEVIYVPRNHKFDRKHHTSQIHLQLSQDAVVAHIDTILDPEKIPESFYQDVEARFENWIMKTDDYQTTIENAVQMSADEFREILVETGAIKDVFQAGLFPNPFHEEHCYHVDCDEDDQGLHNCLAFCPDKCWD